VLFSGGQNSTYKSSLKFPIHYDKKRMYISDTAYPLPVDSIRLNEFVRNRIKHGFFGRSYKRTKFLQWYESIIMKPPKVILIATFSKLGGKVNMFSSLVK
jgi:hypothetical protein